MNPVLRRASSRVRSLVLPSLLILTGSPFVRAADGEWTTAADGVWSDVGTGHWANGLVADGAGHTADFASVDINRTVTVRLGYPRMIGNLVFGDTRPLKAAGWVVSDGGNRQNTLTLAGPTPTITVDANGDVATTVTIAAVIAGDGGLIKDGKGDAATSVLVLRAANTYAGGTSVRTGTLVVANDSALGRGAVEVAPGARLLFQEGASVGNTIHLGGGDALHNPVGNHTLAGLVNLRADASVSVESGRLIFAGGLNTGGRTLTVATRGGGVVELAGAINGGGCVTKGASDGRLVIAGDNRSAYSGTTTLQRGVLDVGHDGALGRGPLVLAVVNDAPGAIRAGGPAAREIVNAVRIVGGNVRSRYVFGSAGAAFNGDIAFTGTADVELADSIVRGFVVHNRTRFDAGFFGKGGLLLESGDGTLVLNGINTYTGETTIDAGTLLVNDSLSISSEVTVNRGGRLGGLGSVGDVAFRAGAALACEVADVTQAGGLAATRITGDGLGGFTVYLTGEAAGFDPRSDYRWTVLTCGNGDDIRLENIALDASGFGPKTTGAFRLSRDANSLYIDHIGAGDDASSR